MQRYPSTGALAALGSTIALCSACARGEVDLGGSTLAQDLAGSSRCSESTLIDDSVRVRNQSEVDALAGCEEITGNLLVETFASADLSALASLRVIGEHLNIGAQREPVTGSEEEAAAIEGYIDMQLTLGGFESLHGLESLERIGGALYLNSIQAGDLTAFASLRDLGGGLFVFDAKNLTDLSGLEHAEIGSLVIESCPTLESLTGLRLSSTLQGVALYRLPALTNLDALEDVTSIIGLTIEGTGLTSLPELSAIFSNLYVRENPALLDASGLAGSLFTSTLVFEQNPGLVSLPDFSTLESVDELIVRNNDSLEEVSLNMPALQPRVVFAQGMEGPLSASFVDISSNAGLTRIASPAPFMAVQYFNVNSNPNLTQIDFGALQRVDFLSIDANASLESITLPSLASVDSLTVTHNPALSPSVFDPVLTFTRNISDNGP